MWKWFGIAVLARVLMASNQVYQYKSSTSLSDPISEDVGERELQGGEESSRGVAMKPGDSKISIFQWKNNHIFRDNNPYENPISSLIGELGSSVSKIIPNNQNEPEDERDKRSSSKEDDPAPPESLGSWMTPENKALPFRNLQDPWQEIKKSRAFSPWGGKRVSGFGQDPKVRRPIRVPFNSWGGKRSLSVNEKRTKFSSWGGKRDWYIEPQENSDENGVEKRTKFNAWGGKRSKNDDRDDEEIKRNRFNAWGGKRNDKTGKRTPEEVGVKKSMFNAWGGKRFFTGDEANLGDDKGLKYGSLDGKGSNMFQVRKRRDKIDVQSAERNLVNENCDEDDENEVPTESEIIKLPEKKGGRNDYIHKSSFNPWGGKKRGESDLDDIETGLNFILPESHHHHSRFWAWGG